MRRTVTNGVFWKVSFIIAVIAAMLGLIATTIAAQSSVIIACVENKSGNVRIVSAASDCKSDERALQWNVAGLPGPQGPQGIPGPVGPQGPAGTSYSVGPGLALNGTQLSVAPAGVLTSMLAANSVTQYAQTNAQPQFIVAGGTGQQMVPGASVSLNSTGGPLLVLVSGWVRLDTAGAVATVSITSTDVEVGGGAAQARTPFTLQSLQVLPPGQHTYQVSLNNLGVGSNAYIYVTSMIAVELKR